MENADNNMEISKIFDHFFDNRHFIIYNAFMREYVDRLTDKSKKSISDFVLYNCGIEQCKSNQFYGPKSREYHLIHFVTRGEGTLDIHGTTYRIHQNQLFVIPANEISTYRAGSKNPWKYCWIGFFGIQSTRFLNSLMQCDARRFVINCKNAAAYEKQLEHILNTSGKQLSTHLKVNGMMYHMLGTLLEESGADDPKDLNFSIPYQAQQYMEMYYHKEIQIADVAASVGVHANYLSSIFQKQYHVTPKQYLSDLRATKACELLLNTDHPVYIVANSVGFTDPLAFLFFFKHIVGIPPSDYRAKGGRTNAEHQNHV